MIAGKTKFVPCLHDLSAGAKYVAAPLQLHHEPVNVDCLVELVTRVFEELEYQATGDETGELTASWERTASAYDALRARCESEKD